MADLAKRFEVVVLRPLQIIFTITAILFLFKGKWWGLSGCVVGLLYLGIVGSKLHPFQSASDLAKGPLNGPAAHLESELPQPEVKQVLIGHACTRIGILIGVATGVVTWAAFGWRWYFVLLVMWVTIMFSGAILKLAFRTVWFKTYSGRKGSAFNLGGNDDQEGCAKKEFAGFLGDQGESCLLAVQNS
jgi:hypothetical protein